METIKSVQARINSGSMTKGKRKSQTAGELTTIDGLCISVSAQAAAIKRGAGVMIGDYFVGMTTGTDLLFSHPAIVY